MKKHSIGPGTDTLALSYMLRDLAPGNIISVLGRGEHSGLWVKLDSKITPELMGNWASLVDGRLRHYSFLVNTSLGLTVYEKGDAVEVVV